MKNLDSVDVSVIVPAYNVQNYIKKCILSLLEQDFKGLYEIIVIDDGSTDKTKEICRSLLNRNNCYFYSKSNGGLSDARNYGIHVSKGKYIMFVDGDDYVTKDFISIPFSSIGNNDIGVFGLVAEDGEKVIYTDVPKKTQSISPKQFWKKIYNHNSIISTSACTKIYKREIFNNALFPVGRFHEDVFALHHIVGNCKLMIIVNYAGYHYVNREDSITTTIFIKKYLDLLDAFVDRISFFRENKKNHYCLTRGTYDFYLSFRTNFLYLKANNFVDISSFMNEAELRIKKIKSKSLLNHFAFCLYKINKKLVFGYFHYMYLIKRILKIY